MRGTQRSEAAPTRLLLLRCGSRIPYYRPEAGISAKGFQPSHDTVSMEHSTTVTPSSNEQHSSSENKNAAGRCAAVTTPKTQTLGLTSDQAFTSSLSGLRNYIFTGGRMEDDAASNCPADHTDDDNAGGCGKTAIKKRRAREVNTHKETQPSESISGVSQRYVRKQSGNQHRPQLPIHDEKIILRPHGGPLPG
ncbi:hypothetical protein MRX96_042631 [Rhipicephalus microplus]